ncbi:MAG: type IV secretory system conjugative DNA transfer family protein [Candidatus Uhrbacteria bacterium]|nr:type IV secretory system conjugative DNA transfer family protein [Candidatus Uhrbacteria bacterium]
MSLFMLQLAVSTSAQPTLGNIDIVQVVTLLITVALIVGVVILLLKLLKRYLRSLVNIRGGELQNVTLMITIPKFVNADELRGDVSIQQWQEDIAIAETFYSAIGGLTPQKGISAWLFGRTDTMALEIVSHEELITFYITVPKYLQEFVGEQIHAQYTNAALEPVEDYNLFSPTSTIVGGYLKFKRENYMPIKTYKELDSDPLNSITNALGKVPKGEGVAVQFIVRSARPNWRGLGKKIVKNMNKGMSLKEAKKGGGMSWKDAVKSKDNEQKEQRKLSQAEEKMLQGIENKMTKAGLEVNIRIISSGKNVASAEEDLKHVSQAFSQFNIYEYGNAFSSDIPRSKTRLIQDFIYRAFNEKYKVILNTEEMASVWHLPLTSTETPNIRWMLARTAPAPPEVPTEGFHIGYNVYRGERREVFMNNEDRMRHMYVIGKTGSGKSWFLRDMALKDIKNGKGVAVIDPHGDLVDSILGSIPKDRIDDVVYFNPSDTDRPMGLNMLEAADENMRDFAVQEMISIFMMLFPPEMIGPMFEHSMRNYMLTLMSDLDNPGTLVEIPRMISDEAFQMRWRAKITDPMVKSFWDDEMDSKSDYHKSEMTGYLVSKVGRFVENEMMRNIIGQSKSAFDFRQIMDEGKILLVNLSKGLIGEVNGNLLGLIIVSKLQMAAFTRANIPEKDRKDFFLYIDEFQNFITPSIATILSEARKYRLSLIMAHQYMGQLVQDGKTEIRDAILGNVGTSLVARVGPEDTEVLAKIFEPTFSAYDLMNTDAYTWNAKIIAGNAQVKPFTLKNYKPETPNQKLFEALREISRLTYGRPKDIVEREIMLRAGIGLPKSVKTPSPPPSG